MQKKKINKSKLLRELFLNASYSAYARCSKINVLQVRINTNLSVLRSRFGFIRCSVHARRSRGNRRRGVFFHDIGRHLLWEVSFEICLKRNPPVSSTRVNAVGRYSSRYEWISARSVPSSTGAAMMSQSLISPFASGRSNCLPQLRVGLIYISDCTRTARVKLPKLSFPQ